jgi:hypothetical protein
LTFLQISKSLCWNSNEDMDTIYVHGTKGHMAVYWPGSHPQNSIWTSANFTHKIVYGPQRTEVFVFVSAAGQYFSILTEPDQYNVFFRILSELVFCLRYTITKTCRLHFSLFYAAYLFDPILLFVTKLCVFSKIYSN